MLRKVLLSLAAVSCLVAVASAKDVDIKKYGAKPDGKTKATAAIQKAIDEVSASGGGRVIVQGGTYLVTPFE